MPKFKKKEIIVQATKIDMPQYVATLEGISTGKKGDYLVTGIDNEQWVVKPEWFHGAYTHLEGDKWKRKPQVLEATQISQPDIAKAPTGDIKGNPGDFKVTGTKGEQWFVKPDIFIKTYDPVDKEAKAMVKEDKNGLQKAIDQIGEIGVLRYLPKGLKLHNCDIHGKYLAHYKQDNPLCPLCPAPTGNGNGTTATEVEHLIELRNNPFLAVFRNFFPSIGGK